MQETVLVPAQDVQVGDQIPFRSTKGVLLRWRQVFDVRDNGSGLDVRFQDDKGGRGTQVTTDPTQLVEVRAPQP